jgi:hypothetical protein
MNCFEFGFDRSRGFVSARGQFWPVAIDRPTRPYKIASNTVQQVIVDEFCVYCYLDLKIEVMVKFNILGITQPFLKIVTK